MEKQKVQFAFSVLLFFLVCAISAAAGGSTEEVYTSFKAGKGYSIGDDVSFLVNYHLFKKPTGISRFPDGGLSHTVAEGVFQVSLDAEGEFQSQRIRETRVSDSGLYSLEGSIFAEYEEHPEFDMSRTNQLLRDTGPAALGFPSPLDYCDKSRKEYIRDLVLLKGDYQYRKEIIRHLKLSPDEAEEILRAMEKRAKDLDGYKQMEYEFISEDTKTELRKQGGLQ